MKKVINRIPPILFIFMICILGFIVGVLTIALWQENWLISNEILNQEFIYQIEDLNVDKRALFFLCLGKRLRAFFILFLLAFSTVNVFGNILFFSLNGLYVGSVMELFTIRYGMQGIMMYLSLILPHGIFYLIGFMILGCWCLNLEKNSISVSDRKIEKISSASERKIEKMRKVGDKGRLMTAFVFVIIGIILESYVNLELFLLFM